VLKYFVLLLMTGCVVADTPQPSDTAFDENKRDWIEVYKNEMRIAIDNEDEAAYHFYFQEYMRLRIKEYKESKKNKP
tara:strand:+ start:47659 stop:47889 length:231 start_codon:yes stop_codon:yes gene_type:complete